MYKIFYVLIIIFMFGCGGDQVDLVENNTQCEKQLNYVFDEFHCNDVELVDEKICKENNKTWNQFSDSCRTRFCSKDNQYCHQGCSIKWDDEFDKIVVKCNKD